MKKKLLLIILCLVFVNSAVFAAQVRKRQGYVVGADAANRMTTSYYLVSDKGTRFSTQEYDYLEKITSSLFIAKTNNKYGVLNGYGNIKIPFLYDEIRHFKYNVFRVKEDNKYGLMDYNGRVFLPIRYSYLEKIDDRILKMTNDSAMPTNTTGAPAGSGQLLGLMDYSGRIISEPKYSYIDKINNYMLRVIVAGGGTQSSADSGSQSNIGGKYGLVDYWGRTILSPQYDYIVKVNNTLMKVKKGSSWGRIEYYNGNIINVMFDYQSYW